MEKWSLQEPMKLVFSRKGFDSSTGGVPSPIFPDDTMISLPIPSKESTVAYKDITGTPIASVSDLVGDLAKIPPTCRAHLDPDLSTASIPRMSGWRPLFGQVGASERHLENQGVGTGDVFLFFGLFRHVEQSAGYWRYVPKSRPMHVIFGWLQIEERVTVSDPPTDKPWALYHPHFQECFKLNPKHSRNVVYVAAESLSLPSVHSLGIAGAGAFRRFSPRLQLTEPDCHQPSRWLLPSWFRPKNRAASLSFHSKEDRWHEHSDGVQLTTVGRGQEFVLNCDHYSEATRWLRKLFDPVAPS